jgi:hypothetical protein
LTTYFERQFLGQNKLYIIIRLMLMLFCFIGYYWSENPKPVYTQIGNIRIGSYPAKDLPNSGELFFILGIFLLLLSLLLMFIPHITISSENKVLRISRFANKNHYLISFSDITHARVIHLRNHLFLRPSFSMHPVESTRFFTAENTAIELQTSSKTRILLATQRPGELLALLREKVPGLMVLSDGIR